MTPMSSRAFEMLRFIPITSAQRIRTMVGTMSFVHCDSRLSGWVHISTMLKVCLEQL